jgi:hypothetical protein
MTRMNTTHRKSRTLTRAMAALAVVLGAGSSQRPPRARITMARASASTSSSGFRSRRSRCRRTSRRGTTSRAWCTKIGRSITRRGAFHGEPLSPISM